MRSCLICEDHALVRDALAGVIAARWPGVAIAQADNWLQSWQLAAEGPEVCVVDLAMPGAEPREGVAGLRRAAPEARILVVTGLSDDRLMLDLVEGGVAGFAQKTSKSDVILAALELILAGGRYLPPRIAELASGQANAPADPRKTPGALLTPRQADVLALLAQGLSNKEIARELGVAPATVKTHVAQAIAIVGASNRTEAAMRAKGLGLI